ncbi:hypothetical protein SLEP1_g12934 [Rubroshorea leprosula]|uniref:WAT1-related protein n=1 Tax=Rubroshorea leprosula TaxID=152421 RepID=A0AAV5IE56_9ROSI|nr:hypothetical protein SLEP1_g12934 [Rubroshorea leprosula]
MRHYCYREVLPFAAMVAVECCNVGTNILFKVATLKGMSYYVFLAYSYANFVLLPFLFIFRSSAVFPSFKFPLILPFKKKKRFPLISRICLLGFIGFFSQLIEYKDIEYISPTLASAISNLRRAFAFILAIGPTVFSSASTVSLQWAMGSSPSNWFMGGLLLAAEYLLLSVWYIIQTQVMKIYPAEFTAIFLHNVCGTIISIPVCLAAEPNLSYWILKQV